LCGQVIITHQGMRLSLHGTIVLVAVVATAMMVMRCDAMVVCDGNEVGVDGDEAGVCIAKVGQ